VLDLGCGTGEDAVFLAGLGHSVVGVDVSPAMVERARAKAVARGVAARFVVGRAEDLAGIDGPFDATYSDFGALNCADLAAVGGALRRVLAPGAPVVLSFLGPRPLPATLLRALTGRGEPRGREQPRLAGIPVPARYPSAADAQGQLGPGFAWTRAFALGVLAPGPDHAPWAVRHPEAFGALAAIEGRLRGWPVLRGLGDHLVLEGRLTGGPA
jgi:SAM-dependent methyltransferase